METAGDGSSSTKEDSKPVVVRVKRKASHSLLDAFWLEINERPLKRSLLDFENLSISDSSGKVAAEEQRTKKVLVKHVETRDSSGATFELMQSLMPKCSEGSESKLKNEDRRCTFKRKNIQEELLSKARESKEILTKAARFEQIWRSRRGNNLMKDDEALHEMYHFYDVVRIDEEEKSGQVPEEGIVSLEDQRTLCNYLPLLREFIPDAAAEIELDLNVHAPKQGGIDEYVYDYYVMQGGGEMSQEDSFTGLPLVQVDDAEDFYDGPDSEYETDDSNAENNPLNEYPDEASTDEELESEETNSEEEEEEEEGEDEKRASNNSSGEDIDPPFEDEDGFDINEDDFDFADGDANPDDWRCGLIDR